jgi:hypothetical protein
MANGCWLRPNKDIAATRHAGSSGSRSPRGATTGGPQICAKRSLWHGAANSAVLVSGNASSFQESRAVSWIAVSYKLKKFLLE